MSRQLNIRSNDAHRLAHEIARRTGRSITEVVETALRTFGEGFPDETGMTATQRAEFDALMGLVRSSGKNRRPGATSDHSDMYDEHGLPK